MNIPTDKLVELAAPIISQVQIKAIHLAWSKCARNPSLADVPDVVDFQFGVKADTRFDRDSKVLTVLSVFGIEGLESGQENPARSIFQIDAAFSVDYTLRFTEGIEEANVEAFGYVNGIFNTYPYWREYVQSQVSRMGFPNVTLPVLTLASLLKMHEKQASQSSELAVETSAESTTN